MKIKIITLFFASIILAINLEAQERNSFIINGVQAGLLGVMDQRGYILSIGYGRNITKRNEILFKAQIGQFLSSKQRLQKWGEFISDQTTGLSITLNQKMRIGQAFFFKPEAGIVLLNHQWIVTTKNNYIGIGKYNTPPNSQSYWNNTAIGYTIALPLAWKLSEKIEMNAGPVYQNDNYGYTVFGAQINLQINL